MVSVSPMDVPHSLLTIQVQGSMTDEQLRNVVQQTVHGADKDGDGKLSFVEFKRLCDPK